MYTVGVIGPNSSVERIIQLGKEIEDKHIVQLNNVFVFLSIFKLKFRKTTV